MQTANGTTALESLRDRLSLVERAYAETTDDGEMLMILACEIAELESAISRLEAAAKPQPIGTRANLSLALALIPHAGYGRFQAQQLTEIVRDALAPLGGAMAVSAEIPSDQERVRDAIYTLLTEEKQAIDGTVQLERIERRAGAAARRESIEQERIAEHAARDRVTA